jgi:sugar lactone lactonase YvrE
MREFHARAGTPGIVDASFFFDAPRTVAADGDNFILTSAWGNTLEVWNPDTRAKVETHSGFATPINAIRFQGNLVVAEQGSGSVILQEAGTEERSVLTDSLSLPSGLAATDNDLWAADWSSGTVWQIFADGSLLEPPTLVASGLDSPEGLAVDTDGSLLVVESGAGRLSRINPNTGEVTIVAEALRLGAPGPPDSPTWIFSGVTVSGSGQIFVTGDIDNVVYRIEAGQ